MITVTPTLTVDGAAVTGSLAGSPSLVAVAALRLTWGRASVLDTPSPATVAVTLLDRSADRSFARRTDLIGRLIVVGWSGSDGSSGTMFRGRITDANAEPRTTGGIADGFLVELAASSREVGLANYTIAQGTTYPAETFAARRSRLAALLPAGSFTGGIVLPDRYDLGLQDAYLPTADLSSNPAAQQDVSGRTLLDLIRELFASTSPLPMVYDPGNDRLTFAPRRRYAYSSTWNMTISAMLTASADHAGRYVAATLGGLHLDAHATAYAGALTQSLDSAVTYTTVTYFDSTAAYAERTQSYSSAADAAIEATSGRRTLTIDTIHADTAKAAQLCTLYADLVDREARAPRLGAVGFSTAREPIHNAEHARALLAGWENGYTLFLGRSWLPALGARPLVGVVGATVSYAAGDWSVNLTPSAVAVDPVGQNYTPVTAASCNPAVTIKASDCDPSLTFGDIAFVDVGPGYDSASATPYRGNPLP